MFWRGSEQPLLANTRLISGYPGYSNWEPSLPKTRGQPIQGILILVGLTVDILGNGEAPIDREYLPHKALGLLAAVCVIVSVAQD